MKKAKENLYAPSLFIIILATFGYFHFFHSEEEAFEKITNTLLIITCILLCYVIHFIIFLFTDNPYNTSAPKYSFKFIVSLLLFWGTPIILGLWLASSIAIYYTESYGKLEPIFTVQIVDKHKNYSSKGGTSYYFHVDKNLRPTLRVNKENYEKAEIGQCVEIQYRTSSLGIYRDYWKFAECLDKSISQQQSTIPTTQ